MEGLLDLGFNGSTLLAQIINFSILLGLLYFMAYKPLMRKLDERSRKIKEGVEEAEAMKEKSTLADEEIKQQLETAGREGQERITRAVRIGDEMKQKAKEEAKQEAEAVLSRARVDIRQERDEAIVELRREFADLTILAASKVIDRSLDKKAHREIIDRVLEESSGLKKE